MINYKYSAVNDLGRTIKGTMAAANSDDLEARLKEIGLDIIDYREIEDKKTSFFAKNITARDLIMFCIHMEQLDKAGVPLMDALADLRDTSDSPRLKELMAQIYESVKGGKMLSAALAEHPRIFGEVFTGLVAAGEKTGHMSDSFGHLSHHIKWNEDIRRKVKKSIRYPIILLVMMVAVISIMMLFVVPQLSSFMLSQGFDLPLHTRALIWTSDTFVKYWYAILGIPTVAVVVIIMMYRSSEDFAYQVDKIALKTPFVGKNISKIDLARFSQFFSVTFMSGIDILECLRTAQNVVGNRIIKEAIQYVRRSVSEGNSLTSSLKVSNQFPSLVIRMFKIGEESGEMGKALDNINFFYEREVNDSVESTVELIQPALTIILGGVLFWITAAVFGPLYDSFTKMSF